MKVALVCDWYYPRVGGIELHLHDLAGQLTAAGHEVVVITPTPGAPVVDGTRVVRIDAPRAPRFGFLVTRGGVRALGDAIATERPDVVHAHVSIVSPAALGGAREAERRQLPLVVTFHSVVPQTALLARVAGTALGVGRWRACFSAVSQRVAREVQPIAPGRPIQSLPNGVDVDFWRAAPRSSSDVVRLVSVMRLNPKKRPLALVQMMRRLSALLGPEHRAHLTIAGDGPWRSRLERAVSAAGLTRQITLVGRQTREQIRTLLGCSDVFVLPTVRESFGLAALEARCAGLPVVAMRTSGVSELIDHGVHGFLADSDADFAAHVARLVRDSSIRAAITEENRRSAPPFDWASVLDAQLSLYDRAIELAYSHEPRAPLDVRAEHVFHAAQRDVPGLEATVDSEAFATEIHELPRMHE